MEIIAGICCICAFILVIGGGFWILVQPKAVKRIGNRRWYVKWNKK